LPKSKQKGGTTAKNFTWVKHFTTIFPHMSQDRENTNIIEIMGSNSTNYDITIKAIN